MEGYMFIRNAWYIAGFSGDLGAGQHFARKILNEPVVVFRTAAGALGAIQDRCSHRAMPLSAGHVEGDVIRCCYHGMEFNNQGVCTRIPGQEHIARQHSIKAYPIAERDNVMWIWMGDPAAADSTQILPNLEHSAPHWNWAGYSFHVKCNWQLLVDNILDLTHLAYVHSRTIGGTPEQHFKTPNQVKVEAGKVDLIRHLPNSLPPRTYVAAKGFKGMVDRWQEVSFEPGRGMALRVNAGGCDAGTGAYEGKRDHGFTLVNVHGVTPETETTTHYIWSIATNAPRDSGVAPILFEQIHATIKEDVEVLEAQQSNISDFPNVKFTAIASDGAVNQARRLLNSLHATESQPAEAMSA
jgi:phenylpropionate dioxygenase-like ring-hydroxylating dioxygenase large terminal subunit